MDNFLDLISFFNLINSNSVKFYFFYFSIFFVFMSISVFKGDSFGHQIKPGFPTNPNPFPKTSETDLRFIDGKIKDIEDSISQIKQSTRGEVTLQKNETKFDTLCKSISGVFVHLSEYKFKLIREDKPKYKKVLDLRVEFLSEVVDFSIQEINQNPESANIYSFKSNLEKNTINKIIKLRKEIVEAGFEESVEGEIGKKISEIEAKLKTFLESEKIKSKKR